MNKLVFQFFAIDFINMWVFHYKHMGKMCKRSNYTQNAPQYEGDCEYRISSVILRLKAHVGAAVSLFRFPYSIAVILY